MGSAAGPEAAVPPRLELHHITKIYGNLVANNDINLKSLPAKSMQCSVKTAPAKAR